MQVLVAPRQVQEIVAVVVVVFEEGRYSGPLYPRCHRRRQRQAYREHSAGCGTGGEADLAA